jgi:hypothetical protein
LAGASFAPTSAVLKSHHRHIQKVRPNNNYWNITCRYALDLSLHQTRLSKCNGSWNASIKQNVNFKFQPPAIFVFFVFRKSKSKAKQSRYTPWRCLGERRYSSYSFTTSALDGVSGQRHDPAALYPRGKDPRYPSERRLGGPQSRSGHRG